MPGGPQAIGAKLAHVELGTAENTAPAAANPSSIIDIPNLAVTFKVTDRPVKAIVDIPYLYHSVAGQKTVIELWRTDTNACVASAQFTSGAAFAVGSVHFERRLALAPGTYTVKARLRNPVATAGSTANVYGDPGPGNGGAPIVQSLQVLAI